MLAVWRVELQTQEKQAEIDKLKAKVVSLENERDAVQESECLLDEKVCQLHMSCESTMYMYM